MQNAPPDNATCVSVATDGLSPDRNNIMAVSYAVPGDAPKTVYIRGADVNGSKEYNGVSEKKYDEEAVGILRAEEILREAITTDLLVTYSVNMFTRRWLFTCLPGLFGPGRHNWLDVLSYIAYGDEGNPFPVEAEDIDAVCTAVNPVRGGSFMSAVNSRLPKPALMDPVESLPLVEQKIHHLAGLWDYCLNREL
jgi:hypothetical protein